MREEIGRLLRLQKADRKVAELEKDLAELPEETQDVERRLSAKQTEKTALDEEIERETVEHRSMERELEGNEAKIGEYNRKLTEVKTNREYSALQQEIGNIRDRNDELEEKVLLRMESLDERKAKRKVLEQEVSVLEKEREETRSRVEKEIGRVEELLRRAREERETAASVVDRALLAQYERIRSGKGGVAVAKIERDACEVCYRAVPPQSIIEIKKLEKIITCEGCGRILVWAE